MELKLLEDMFLAYLINTYYSHDVANTMITKSVTYIKLHH